MKLDLDNKNVFEIDASTDSIRAYLDGSDIEEVIKGFDTALDEAQGSLQFGDLQEAYIVIKVVR